jgi:hypothetical protein
MTQAPPSVRAVRGTLQHSTFNIQYSIFFFLLLAPAASAAPAPPLGAAVSVGEARMVLRGAGVKRDGDSSGDSLRLEVENLAGEERVWEIPRGALAVSKAPATAKMVVRRLKGKVYDEKRYEPAETVRLEPGEKAVYVLEAYSLNHSRGNISRSDRFDLKGVLPFFAVLFEEADRMRTSVRAVQAAVWIRTSGVTRSDLASRFPVSPEDYAMAQGLVRLAEEKFLADSTGKRVRPPLLTPLLLGTAAPGSTPAAPSGPALELSAGPATHARGADGERSVTIPILYQWNVEEAQRPRQYVAALRFESPETTSAVVASGLVFDGESGRFDAVTQQGGLSGTGSLAYAVFGDLTPVADQSVLKALFTGEEAEEGYRLSNILRVPVDWDAPAGTPASPSPTPIPAPMPAPAPASPPVQTPPQPPRQTPASARTPMPPAAAVPSPPPAPAVAPYVHEPIAVVLPLKNRGLLSGRLEGVEDGRLVLSNRGRRFTFDPAEFLHTPEQFLSEARKAHAEGRRATALQYAAVAALLLEEPSEARALVRKLRGAR